MSRIGRKEIVMPKNVKARIEGNEVFVEGPKGKLKSPIPSGITANLEDGKLNFDRPNDEGPTRAAHGLARALANNCVVGVTQGFKKQLQIIGVGYRVNVKGSTVEFHLGYSHPIDFKLPDGISAQAEQDRNTKSIILTLEGIDKQLVGQVAANIRSLRKPEPYKGKGVRYLNEQILRKAGKSGK
ncbi:50S ribosomal protein L6 [Sulfidibacter corallicola]|uniref:Large ribosomal subunit protein uL6 n=1 Tax=Sulfidibacter corallicola TaxID=2818388 RepID=A0A8A4TMP5_SULCO|nr:50S ribosomal protein L6 [Sulfidibacter corallicola]QTD47865.1 50S ribosomal protein L6 [Sulfidibacter corallicola]